MAAAILIGGLCVLGAAFSLAEDDPKAAVFGIVLAAGFFIWAAMGALAR